VRDEYASICGVLLRPLARRGGIRGLLRFAHSLGLREILRRIIRVFRRSVGAAVDRLYDRRHLVDTCGRISAKDLPVDTTSRENGNEYAPVPQKSFRAMLESVPVDFREYTFIDYGSGKGRALLLAAEQPFRQVVGVEYSEPLARIADANISSYQNGVLRCRSIEALFMDATLFEPPSGPCLFWLFSPFHGKVLRRVLKRIETSYVRDPRPMVILYCEEQDTIPIPTKQFEAMGFMHPVKAPPPPYDLGAPVPLIYSISANTEALG
jgi:SAM-dependent methyltransferase